MPDRPTNLRETGPLAPEQKKEAAREDSKEVKEVLQSTEVAEFIEGEISEEASEGKKKVSSGMPSSKGATTAAAADPTKAVFPNLDVMRIQISTKVRKEIVDLEKEASRIMRNPAKFDPFKLNRVMARIRHLKDILARLAHITTESVKNLWQKYVKSSS